MKHLLKGVAALALAASSLLVTAEVSTAGATTACSVGQMCVSRNTGGGGSQYEFASNDSALNNNSYSGGVQVSDNNLSTRNRNANFTRACVYADFSYTGEQVGNAPYNGATWVTNVNQLGSSIRWMGSTC